MTPDAITSSVERRLALDQARAALNSGMRSQLRAALQMLPESGVKAQHYRQRIEEALSASSDKVEPLTGHDGMRAACVVDGLCYEFVCGDFAEMSFFRATRSGALIRVVINAAHPYGKRLLEEERLNDGLITALLAAWAHYELDQISAERETMVCTVREDWGRTLRRLLDKDGGFASGNAP